MSGHLGIELAVDHHPDLVMLDLHLPDLPGEEVLQQLRADPATAGARVAIVSADASPGRVERMLDDGADHYLTKPIDVAALLGLVDGMAKARQA